MYEEEPTADERVVESRYVERGEFLPTGHVEVPHQHRFEEEELREDYDHYKHAYEEADRQATRAPGAASSFEGSVGSSSGGDTVVFRPKTQGEKGSASATLISWEPDAYQRRVEYDGEQRSVELSLGAEEEDAESEVMIHLSEEEEEEDPKQ